MDILSFVSFIFFLEPSPPTVGVWSFFKKKSYLLMSVLGLCCCTCFSLVAVNKGYSLVALCRLFIAVASLVAGLQASAVAWAQ